MSNRVFYVIKSLIFVDILISGENVIVAGKNIQQDSLTLTLIDDT